MGRPPEWLLHEVSSVCVQALLRAIVPSPSGFQPPKVVSETRSIGARRPASFHRAGFLSMTYQPLALNPTAAVRDKMGMCVSPIKPSPELWITTESGILRGVIIIYDPRKSLIHRAEGSNRNVVTAWIDPLGQVLRRTR